MRFTIVLIAAGAVLLSVVAAPVAADTFTFNATNGVWNDAANWDGTEGQ
ncbi:MAG: hypothetical protein IID36_07880, partial [Planctomycetes bacterium]|nr:hypothetical protein [Planctomycetota bacterium]